MNFTFNDVDLRDIRSLTEYGIIEKMNRIRKSWVLLTKDTNFEDRLKSHPAPNRRWMYNEIDSMIKRRYIDKMAKNEDILPDEILLEVAKDVIYELDRQLQYYEAIEPF